MNEEELRISEKAIDFARKNKKDIDGTDFKYRENIDIVDNYIPEKYSKEELEKLIVG